MDFFSLTGILARADDALLALLSVIIIQLCLIPISSLLKKSISPLPFVEMALRPFVVFLCDKLNRGDRSDFALIIRGSIVFFIILAVITCVGIAIEYALVAGGFGAFMDIILLGLLLSPIAAIMPAYAVSSPVPKKGSYRHVAQGLNQNLIISDEYGLRRCACKLSAISLSEWVVGPIVLYLLGGIPLACLYVTLSMFVRIDSTRNKSFLSVYAFLYIILQKLTSIIIFPFVFLASIFSAGGKPLKILDAVSENGLLVEGYLAYTQNITLGGTYQNRHGAKSENPWAGPEGTTAKIEKRDVIRVLIQYCITIFLIVVALFALYVFL